MKKVAAKAGNVAMIAGHKTRLHGEILLVDREVRGRKQQFGIDLYNHVGPMANSPDFFAADDPLTETLRPPLLTAQREIAALNQRRTRIKEDIKQAEVKRAAAFPDKAITFADKAKNAARSAALAGNETKLATDLSVVESKVKHFKQLFGEEIYEIFVKLEDEKGWLPTDRTIRAMYDQARQDVEKLAKKRAEKIQELESLGGSYSSDKTGESYDAPTTPATCSMQVPTTQGNSQHQQHQGMFATTNTSTLSNNNYPPAPAPTDIFATPAASMTSTTMSYPTPTAPISQTTSYMQTQVSPAGGTGYSDTMAPTMGGGGYTDTSLMGGTMGSFSNGAPMGGFSDGSGQMGGFADFPTMSGSSGNSGGGFPAQPQVDPTGFADFQRQRMQQKQQSQSTNGITGFPNTQGGNNNYPQNPSSSSSGPPNNDLLW